jgi:eukaryotic-like serine/threonine-protein kinase
MRSRIGLFESLVMLARVESASDRRANWRQIVASLGQSIRVDGPSPLDSIDTELVVNGVRVALTSGLVDDLEWIEPRQSAVALYELTSALPAGRERRELGRRVFGRVYEGTASTFNAVAIRIALSAARSLDTPALRARVSLLLDLPTGSTVNPDALALALVVRRENFERWVARPSVGSLSARRLAAKTLEHATREAALRAQQGDSYPKRRLLSSDVQSIFRRLLADREPLVWRHAAVARGLLASAEASIREEVESSLDPGLTPTEWRRAAVSLVALLPSDPHTVLKQCHRLQLGDIGQADPGIAAAMVAGLPRVIEAEPEAAETLLGMLANSRRLDVAEAIASLLGGLASRTFGERTAQTLRHVLDSTKTVESNAATAIKERILALLDRNPSGIGLQEGLRQALVAYETQGARAAHQAAMTTIEAAHSSALRLTQLNMSNDAHMAEGVALLTDLDMSCLERSTLVDLLLLNRRPGESDASVPQMESLYFRLGNWLLDAEERSIELAFDLSSPVIQQRRLKTLLHLIDAETITGDAEDIGQRLRARVRRALQVLTKQLIEGPDGSVHRVLCATLARTFDAAVRENVCDPSDLLLLVASKLLDRESIGTIAEASTNQDVAGPLAAYAQFLDLDVNEGQDAFLDPPSSPESDSIMGDELIVARRVVRLSQGIGAGGAYRAEALRQVVLRLGRGLEAVAAARGLSELVDRQRSGFDALREVERSAAALRELTSSAVRRVFQSENESRADIGDVIPLSVLVERTLADGIPPNAHLVAKAVADLTFQLPEPVGHAINQVVSRIDSLPPSASSDVYPIPLDKRRSLLPDWLLPRRTIGSFYVVRALGSGGVSSVFVARRSEERNSPHATLFALKVPEYDPTTARSLSEQEFMQLFQEEASALLAIPHHPNLARFVTFDLAARPKPILVMELISGFALDRLVRSRSLSVERALRYLSGILAGLEAMHSFDIGHLDLKPSNVILRDGETPVLVDFGLSGRKIRRGCGTLDYCAPEVLGVLQDNSKANPMTADVYAFGSMAFEVLTGQPLFEGMDEMSLVTAHVTHDGWPEKLARLASHPRNADLSVVLAACLRHNPGARPTAAEARAALDALAPSMADLSWPLAITRPSQKPMTA